MLNYDFHQILSSLSFPELLVERHPIMSAWCLMFKICFVEFVVSTGLLFLLGGISLFFTHSEGHAACNNNLLAYTAF